jgi:glucan phosphoethanolaminetransferase (alkaline phosphatase superfamily)
MSADQNRPGRPAAEAVAVDDRPNWRRRLGVAAGLVVLVLLGGLVASATVPRWWAHRVGDQVDGSITQGILVGLFYGFLFTLLPLTILAAVLLWRRRVKWLVAALVVALVAAAPNLMTLGIVLGNGNASHAGDRILDVEAPAFRGASLAGALAGAALVLFVSYLVVSRRRARSRERNARSQLETASDPAARQTQDV